MRFIQVNGGPKFAHWARFCEWLKIGAWLRRPGLTDYAVSWGGSIIASELLGLAVWLTPIGNQTWSPSRFFFNQARVHETDRWWRVRRAAVESLSAFSLEAIEEVGPADSALARRVLLLPS